METMYVSEKRNMTLLMDFYEMTMAAGYFEAEHTEEIAVFDMFFRRVPDGGGFAIAAGLAQFIECVDNFRFTDGDIEYLRGKGIFSEPFLAYLRDFRFECNIWASEEGTPVFPGEPIVTVEGPAIQAQLLETMLLVTFNHQSLIATKSNRIVRAAQGRPVMEFGSRRAQSYDAAVLGARAGYIAGCSGTACTITDELYGVKALGTMAHSWVQMFPNELDAFKAYCECYPDNAVLLVDTYDVLNSGVPNAIRAFDEVLKPLGIEKCGIRLDSGDLAYLTKQCRKLLDAAGWEKCTITCSNSLDEYAIRELLRQGGQVDSFGVGERMITASSEPVFGGVYKLAAVEDEQGTIHPRIKISENVAKITVPGFKKTYRFFDEHGMAAADCMFLHDEEPDFTKPFELFDPEFTWKRKTMENYTVRELQVPVFLRGELVYALPTLEEIRAHCAAEIDTLWEEVKRFDAPHQYYVDLSRQLWELRDHLLRNKGKE